MSITIECPGCGKRFALKEELAGRRIQCKCGQAMIVPAPAATEPEDPGGGLGSMEPPDPLRSLLDDDALPTAAKLPPASAARKAPASAPTTGPASPRKPKVSIDRAVLAKIVIVPVVLVAVGLLVMHLLSGVSERLKPGYPTPQEAMISYQKALGERDWRSQMAMLDKASQERAAAWVASTAQVMLADQTLELGPVLSKYGIAALEKPDESADASMGVERGGLPTEPAEDTPPDLSQIRQQAEQKRLQLVAGVQDKAQFYIDILEAITRHEAVHAATNPLIRANMRIEMKEALKSMAAAKISKVAIDGDVAQASLSYTVGGIPQRVQVLFKKIDDRWFVHMPGPQESMDESFANYFTAVMAIQWP